MDTFPIHVIDGIAATATYADDFNNAIFFFGLTEIEYAGSIVVCEI